MTEKLSRQTLGSLPAHVVVPGYDLTTITPGIVHIGWGNFAMAHLGSIMDDVLDRNPSWGIIASDLRLRSIIDGLRADGNLYAKIVRKGDTRSARVLAPVVDTIFAPDDPQALVNAIATANIRLVTITVTAAGYYLDSNRTSLDTNASDIKHDLEKRDETPLTIYPYLLKGIRQRLNTHGQPIVLMSLDNVEANSKGLKLGLLEFAAKYYIEEPDLVAKIQEKVDFPVTLIDRITPRTSDEVRKESAEFLGFDS